MKSKIILVALICLWGILVAQTTLPSSTQVMISVNVTGFVANPGTYQLTPLNRISDALEQAKKTVKTPAAAELLTPQQTKEATQDSLYLNFQALRSVKLIRGKETYTYDVLKYLREGDLSQNPLLRDADVVIVSPVHSSVSIMGEVYLPGEYEFVTDDKLSDILALAQGLTLGADQTGISIYRYKENLIDFDILKVDLGSQNAASISLQANDRIIISKALEQRRAWKITVKGNVKAPGEYLIGENTTLYDILQQSGGPSSRGDLRNAVYANGTYTKEPDVEFERLMTLSISQMTTMEYHYMRNKLRQFPGKYSIDVSDVWEAKGNEPNPKLHDGDYLYVPEYLDMVEVSGQVTNPGLVPWVEGKNWEYYIQSAGGFTNNRRLNGTRIIKLSSGNWLKPTKKVPIEPGDNVFVAEKNEHDFWTDFKDVILITSQLVTIYLGIKSITTP